MGSIIELQGVTKDFRAFRALDQVSLEIGEGITALLGPNGAGKSTLIKILLGLLRASSGSGRLLGYDLCRQHKAIRAQVGYLPEDDCYWPGLSGVESVQVSARLSLLPRIEALRRSHEILDFCGVRQERYRNVETYSTGMRQKLRFAQAIVHDPPVLILDEPTSGLDPEEREAMLNRIRRLARDHRKTILLCTHILPDVQSIADSVVVLARGQVRLAGTLHELSRPPLPSMQIRLLAGHERFAQTLRDRGLSVDIIDAQRIAVRGAESELIPHIWRAARECQVGVRALAPSRNSIEEIFLSALQEQLHAPS